MIPTRQVLAAASFLLLMIGAATASAQLSVTPITWDVVGLDSNRPLTEGPELFPVAARVCSGIGTGSDPVQVEFQWDGPDSDSATVDDWVVNRPGSLTTLDFDPLAAGECVDAYFEIQVMRGAGAFEVTRPYRILATAGSESASSPEPRQIFIERLVSQNRNVTQTIRWGQQADGSDWQLLGAGGALNLVVGETYFIELTTETANAYEQIESFITLSNTIFQILGVETEYSTRNFDPAIPDPNPSLYGDGCRWDPEPDSPNYLSCRAAGKAGGTVTTVYEIRIVSGGGERTTLEALIYDFSGSSFHYNTDFTNSPGELVTFTPTAPDFGKRFIPGSMGADGTATVRFTISNPNPVPVSGYSFGDNLPAGMEIAAVPNASSNCGGTLSASAGGDMISLAGGGLDGNASCTVLVDVTVPFDAGASYPLTLLNDVDLLVGDPGNPEFIINATAELEVTEFPPPPQVCTPNPLAAWSSFDNATAPSATADPENRTPTASGGTGLSFTTGSISGKSVWNAFSGTAGQNLSAALSADAYYQFSLDTVGLGSVDFALEAFRQNGNAPATLTLFWGTDASTLSQSTTLTPVPTRSNAAGFRNFRASGLDNLDDGTGGGDGVTVFRVYAYDAANTNQAVSILNVLISSGETCVDVADPSTAPDPPVVAKRFEAPPGTTVTSAGLGQQVTLAFTISNPNADSALTGVSLVDALPPGLSVVPGSLVNNCTGGVWEENPAGVLVLDDSALDFGASCTLSVGVTTTAAGALTNVSDPVIANETLPGNSAQASLTVEPPPTVPSIVKVFDPDPLFDPGGTSTLLFRVTNNDLADSISQVAFSDNLPAGLQVAGTPNAGTANCGAPGFSPVSGATSLSFTGGTIPPNDNPSSTSENVCEVRVDVVLSDPGVGLPVWFDNSTSPVSHIFNGVTFEGNTASATLLVDAPIPGVRLLKQVGLSGDIDGAWSDYAAVPLGDGVFYRYTVENVGESPLSAISLSDPDLALDVSSCIWTDTAGNPLPADFTLPVADFGDPEAHIAVCIIGSESITQPVVSTTLAQVDATASTGSVQDIDDATVAGAGISLDKSADRAAFSGAGETIGYVFTVTNGGAAILNGPAVINDPLIPGASCPVLDSIGNGDNFFDPGEVLVCTGSYVTAGADVTAGQVRNTAFASTPEVDSADSTVTVVLATPALGVTKSLAGNADGDNSGTISEGDALTYTVTVTNTGNVELTNVTVTDTLIDPSVTSCATLDVGADCVLTGTYTVTAADITTGSISNTGTGDSDESGPVDDTLVTPVSGNPALEVDKALTGNADEDGSGDLSLGDTLTYTVTATNTGNITLSNVIVTDTLIGPSSETCATLAVGGNCTLTGTYIVEQTDADSGEIVNTATADSDQTDPIETGLTTTISRSPAIELVKQAELDDADDNGFADLGENISYTLTATNIGNVTLSGVMIDDPLIGPLDCSPPTPATLAPGDQVVCTGSLEVTPLELDSAAIVNVATATGTGPGSESVASTSTVTTATRPALPSALPVPLLSSTALWVMSVLFLLAGFVGATRRQARAA